LKTILSLVIAALIVNACFRAGDSVWRHRQLLDAVDQETRYGQSKTTSMLRKKVIELAAEQGVTLAPEDVVVEKRGLETYVAFEYLEPIPLVPKAYTHEQPYDVTISAQSVRPIVDDKK
jgi:hypothetical protein